MKIAICIYVVYVIVSVLMTMWVARTLHRNGRIFLVDAFGGNEQLADSVNHLLVVGFYLVNLGFILLFLRIGTKPADLVTGIEYIATKLGIVMLVLGVMHFGNVYVFNALRNGKLRQKPKDMHPNIPPVPMAHPAQ
jgi:hypothetical protein